MAEGGTVIEDTVDSYEVFHRNMLGGGTFGTVFLGRDMRTNESVAIKCIEPPIQYRARYMRYIENELHALNSIDHPNVVDLIHYKEIGHCMYFILECCECDLQKFAIENDVFQELKFDFIQGLAEGVNCLHCHRIIHRDIKPENVLVKEAHGTRTAKLTDLGLSRRVPEGGSASCSFTPGVGTRHWMAPEVFADSDGHARYSKPSDIYSFGLLSGSVIVHNPGESLCPLSGPHGVCIGQWTHEQQSAGQTVNIPQLTGGEDSAEVQAMKQSIERMIHPEASQRYKAQEVCNAIRNIVNGSFTRSMPAAAYIPPPATGLSVTQAGSHVRLSDVQCHAAPTGLGPAELSGVRQLMPATSDIPANDLLSMQDESSLQLSNVAENIVSQTDRSSQTGSLALQVENSKRPEKPEPQKAESASPASTIPPLPLSSHPDTSRLTLYPHDSVKQHDASHQIHPALESVQTQSKAMQKEVSSMKLQIEALTLKTTSTSGMEMEPAPTSAVQTATTSSPTKQAGQILHPLMQSEPTPTIKQQMELASTTVMDVEQTPSTTTNRDPNPVSDVDLPMQAETPKAHTQTEAAAGKVKLRVLSHFTVPFHSKLFLHLGQHY